MAKRSETRIAVVGAGLVGRAHAEIVSGTARLDAIIDPDPDAGRIAGRHGADWHPDLAEYMKSGSPDGAIVAAPNHLHLPLVKTCLECGVPVLVEKPLADGIAGARSLVQAVRATGVPVLVGHHRRHSRIAELARDLIEGGRIGSVVAVNAMFWLNKHDDYFNVEWRVRPGGGPICINLIHDIDLLQHFCGPITSVQARCAQNVRGLEVEDTGAMIFEFASGALGTASVCDATSAPWSWELTAGENPIYPKTDQFCYQIAGTTGALSVPDLTVWAHAGPEGWWSPITHERIAVAHEDPMARQFKHFLDVIHSGVPPLVGVEDGLRNIEVIEAIQAAAKSGNAREIVRFGQDT